MGGEAGDVAKQVEVFERWSGQRARASSWLRPDVLLILSLALAACGTSEPLRSTPVDSASPNPRPSSTPQPSTTPTTSPTPSPAPSATPESFIQDHPDGSKSFIDLKVGYSITFPPGWLILEMSERKNDEVFSAAAEEFPDLEDRIAIFSLTSPDIRMFALAVDPIFLVLDTPPLMGVLVTDSPSSPSLDFMLRQSTVALSRFLEAEILSSEQITNSEGVLLGIVTYQFGPSNEVELLASTFGKAAMFYFEDSLVTVTGSVNQALREELEPVFDMIYDKIELVDS